MKLTIDSKEPIMNRLRGDKVIWIVVFLLSLISIALIYSSSSSKAFKDSVTNFSILMEQCKFVGLGIVFMYICYRIPLGLYRYFTYVIFGISLVLLMLTPIIGVEYNGAKRWLPLGPITIQPAEFVKVTLILYLAKVLELFSFDTFKEFLIKVIAPIGVVCVVIMMSSVSTTLFVGALSLIILIIAGVKWSYLFKSMLIGAATLIVLVLLNLAIVKIFNKDFFPRFSTAINRVEKFISAPEVSEEMTAEEKQKKADETFQADMAKIAISSSNILGKGPGKSTQRYVLPHPYSDFIYAIIIEEYGMLGGVFVLMLYIWLFYRCVLLAKSCKRKFTALTVGGIGFMITAQALLHILVNVGILPVTGHTLPLISLGGTSFVIFSCAFGIILSVSRTVEEEAAKREEEKAAAIQPTNGQIEAEFHTIIDEQTGEFK